MITKNTSLSLLLVILSAFNSTYSQEDVNCDGARYRYLVFDEFEKIEDVVYGSNIAANGSEVDLEMDIYLPAGDTVTVSYTHLRAHETRHDLVCRLLLEKKKLSYIFCI